MAVVLGPNQYGKAETRVVRIYRDTAQHEIRDLNVSTTLRGDFAAAHVRGDQAQVLPTDSQKNTCFAYASEHGVAAIEDYALALARPSSPVRAAAISVRPSSPARSSRTGRPAAGRPRAVSSTCVVTALMAARSCAIPSWLPPDSP